MQSPDPNTPAILDQATTLRALRFRRGGAALTAIGMAAVVASFLWRAVQPAALDELLLYAGVGVSFVGFVMSVEGRYLQVIADLKQELARVDRPMSPD